MHCIVRIVEGRVQTQMTLLGSCSMKDVQDKTRVGFVIHYGIDIPISLRTGQQKIAGVLLRQRGYGLIHPVKRNSRSFPYLLNRM